MTEAFGSPERVSLVVNGKQVEVSSPGHDPAELDQYISSAEGFQELKRDPKGVIARFGLNIDDSLAEHLANALSPYQDLEQARSRTAEGKALAASSFQIVVMPRFGR
jgi:hypothetical protein